MRIYNVRFFQKKEIDFSQIYDTEKAFLKSFFFTFYIQNIYIQSSCNPTDTGYQITFSLRLIIELIKTDVVNYFTNLYTCESTGFA